MQVLCRDGCLGSHNCLTVALCHACRKRLLQTCALGMNMTDLLVGKLIGSMCYNTH